MIKRLSAIVIGLVLTTSIGVAASGYTTNNPRWSPGNPPVGGK